MPGIHCDISQWIREPIGSRVKKVSSLSRPKIEGIARSL